MNREEILRELFSTMARMKRTMHHRFQSGFEKLGVSPSQADLLMHIYKSQPLSHKALADILGLTPGAVSQLLEGLDRSGYIIRTADPGDRRVSYLSISRSGKRKIDEFSRLREQLFTAAFSTLTDEELAIYLQVQQKMIHWFETNQPLIKKR